MEKSAKIFVDVGGHIGETVEAAVDPKYGFDVIYSFEPVRMCFDAICAIPDNRVRAINAALSNREGEAYVFSPGELGASVYARHMHVDPARRELCRFVDAGRFFSEHIREVDRVYLKLNCEGSECDVIESLCKSGQVKKITALLIDFDIEKVGGQERRKTETIAQLRQAGVRFWLPSEVMYGQQSHIGGIENWLRVCGAIEYRPLPLLRSTLFHCRNILNHKHVGYYKFKIVKRAPRVLLELYYRHFKRR